MACHSTHPLLLAPSHAHIAQVDMFGYYAALGLDASRRRAVSADDIKSAFRKAAQTMHPDKFSLADEEDRLAAEENFKKVQKVSVRCRQGACWMWLECPGPPWCAALL